VPGRQAVAYGNLQGPVNPTDDARGHADLNRALATQIIQRYALAPASANPSFAISAKARCLSTPVPLA
jgi:hypothetical protein